MVEYIDLRKDAYKEAMRLRKLKEMGVD